MALSLCDSFVPDPSVFYDTAKRSIPFITVGTPSVISSTALMERFSALSMTASVSVPPTTTSVLPEVPWQQDGYNTWSYQELKVNYIAAGAEEAPPILLIHGFGASGYHWRRNINVLAAAGFRVYAIDLIGFGLSDKPIIDYEAELWVKQCAAFLREVAGCSPERRAVVAGNSIGGFTALALAASQPDLVRGCVSVNGAGRFAPSAEEEEALRQIELAKAQRSEVEAAIGDAAEKAADFLGASLRRAVIYGAFFVTKQPARIQQVLRQVYPVAPDMADTSLVNSIEFPARDPNAPEVFYRIVSRNGNGPAQPIDSLLETLECPLLLLWGEKDPWIVSSTADRIQARAADFGKQVRRVSVAGGHCPHDEAPAEVNAGLIEFIRSLP